MIMETNLLRKVQLVQLEILQIIDKICEEQGITYYLAYGTLLGAVRHKGFIPWDDDLDLMLPRADYERLMTVLPAYLPDNFWLQNENTDTGYYLPYAKVRKKGTLCKEKLQENIPDEKCGIWVDIFPLDGCNDNFAYTIRANSARTLSLYLRAKQYGYSVLQCSRRYIPSMLLLSCLPTRLIKKLLHWCMVGSPRNSSFYAWIPEGRQKSKRELFPGRCFKVERLCFEDGQYPCPQGFDELLTIMYGDYMTPPPVDSRYGHNISTDTDIIV